MLVSWNWLKDYIGETDMTAVEAADLLGKHAFEVEDVTELADDTIIDIDVLPNRSSDCLSHRGIARELASITGVPLAHDPLRIEPTVQTTDAIAIDIEDDVACSRFSASLVQGVHVTESPDWLKKRLQAIGQRPINNIVDATNYVMFALGQPLHAYDAERFPQVDGQWQFTIRYARPNEEVQLLPESGTKERVVECQGTELLVVDGSSDTPIGLAGVKGGSFAGVHSGTTQIIIEAAHFDPVITRKTARRLGIVIDASKRFENEPAPELVPYAQAAIRDLITSIAGGASAGMVDAYIQPPKQSATVVSPERVNAVLGLVIATDGMVDILERIGASVTQSTLGLEVTPPFERTDLNLEEDYIEEIGRLYGYDNIDPIEPTKRLTATINARHFYSEQIRHTLIALGYVEVITSSFRKKDDVQLHNALASDKSYLRSTLGKNIQEALDFNAGFVDLLGTTDTRVFEIGTVFRKGAQGIDEHTALAIGVRVKASGYSGKEDAVLREALTAIEEKLGITISWEVQKGVAETNLSALLEQLPDPTAYAEITPSPEISYQPFSNYPAITRDIAMWVPVTTCVDSVQALLAEVSGELCQRITHIDTYEKDGRQSLAFRMVFQAMDRTLTDAEINQHMDAVYNAVAERDWEVR